MKTLKRLKSREAAKDYYNNDLFDKMEKSGIISDELAGILKEMKGFDDEIVYSVVKNKLEDFRKFRKEIINWIGEGND